MASEKPTGREAGQQKDEKDGESCLRAHIGYVLLTPPNLVPLACDFIASHRSPP